MINYASVASIYAIISGVLTQYQQICLTSYPFLLLHTTNREQTM